MPFGTNDRIISTPAATGFGVNDRVVSNPTANSQASTSVPKSRGLLDAIGGGLKQNYEDFMAPVREANANLKSTADRVIGGRVRKMASGDFSGTAAPGQYQGAADLKDAIDLGGAALGYVTAPLNAPVSAAVKPFTRRGGSAIYNAGLAPKGMSEQDVQKSTDDTVGMIGGLASMALGNEAGGARVFRAKPPRLSGKPAIPTVDDLRAAKTDAYQRADSAGAVYHPQAVDDMVSGLSKDLTQRRLNPNLAPVSAKLLDEMQTLRGNPASFHDLEEMRQFVGESVGPTASPREKMYAGMIRSRIDDFMNNAGPKDMVSGDPQAQASAINEARQANVTYRKAEAINNALSRADLQAASTGTGGNIDNATRQKLRGLLLDRKMSWTAEEKAGLEKVIRGEPVQNLLRLVGRLSPEGNGLMMAGHLAMALPTHGLSAVGALAGAGSKVAAESMTQANVDALLRTVTNPARIGGAQPSANYAAIAARLAPPQRTAAIPSLGLANTANGAAQLPIPAPPFLPLQAAAEPPRKRKRKK